MAEISWQNVNAPSNDAVFRGMALASAGLDRASAGFEGAGKTLTDANQANMDQADAAKTAAIKSIMSGVSTPEQLAEARGQIAGLAGGMFNQDKAGGIYDSLVPAMTNNAGNTVKTQGSNQTQSLANINDPVAQQKAKYDVEQYDATAAENQRIALLNDKIATVFKANDVFNLDHYLGNRINNANIIAKTTDTKAGIDAVQSSKLDPIIQSTTNMKDLTGATEAAHRAETRQKQSAEYQKQDDITADNLLRGEMNKNVVDFWKTGPQQPLAEIGGLEGTMQLGAAKTKADYAEATNKRTVAENAPEEAAQKTYSVLSDRASQYAKEQKTLKETRFNQDSMGSVYKNAETPVDNIADLSNTFAEAKYQASKELNMDLTHVSQEAMNEIALRGNLDPNWLMSTSVDSYKEMIKDYVRNRGGAAEMENYLSTEKSSEEKTAAAETTAQLYEINHLPEQVKVKQDVKTDAQKEKFRQSILPIVQDAEDPDITGTPYRDAPKDSKPVSETVSNRGSSSPRRGEDTTLDFIMKPVSNRGSSVPASAEAPKRASTPIEIFNETIRQAAAKR